MSGYNMGDFIHDYVDRTYRNFQHIVEMPKEKLLELKLFEVTHMVNTLFGLLIVPYEAFKQNEKIEKQVNKKKFSDAFREAVGYETISNIFDECIKEKRFYTNYEHQTPLHKDRVYSLLYHIRNSLAHSGDNTIGFYPIKEYQWERESIDGPITDMIEYTEVRNFAQRKRYGQATGTPLQWMLHRHSQGGEPQWLKARIPRISKVYYSSSWTALIRCSACWSGCAPG